MVYDYNGSALSEIDVIYDYNGTTTPEIGVAYDYDGTTQSVVYEASTPIYNIPIGARMFLPASDGTLNWYTHFMMADHNPNGNRHTCVMWAPSWPDLYVDIATGVWYEGGLYGNDLLSQRCKFIYDRINPIILPRIWNESKKWIRNLDGTGNYVITPNAAQVWPLGWSEISGDSQGQSTGISRLQYFATYGWDNYHSAERNFTRDWFIGSAGYQITVVSGGGTTTGGGYCRPCVTLDNNTLWRKVNDYYVYVKNTV